MKFVYLNVYKEKNIQIVNDLHKPNGFIQINKTY